jgi:hypothetical protein
MNHYDDLQRFKEKTRTQSLDFKDLSSHAAAREQGDWVILNQLSPGEEKESSLAMGGSVSLPIPQPVPTDMFHWVEAEPAHTPQPTSPAAPAPVMPPLSPFQRHMTPFRLQNIRGQQNPGNGRTPAPQAAAPPAAAQPLRLRPLRRSSRCLRPLQPLRSRCARTSRCACTTGSGSPGRAVCAGGGRLCSFICGKSR